MSLPAAEQKASFTSAREVVAFYAADVIKMGALYLLNPVVLRPLYISVYHSHGVIAFNVVSRGVGLLLALLMLPLFLLLRGWFRGVPGFVAGPGRALASSRREIEAYIVGYLIAAWVFPLATNLAVQKLYEALRANGHAALVSVAAYAVTVLMFTCFLVFFLLLRRSFCAGPLGFGDAIAACLKRYAAFSGRASRTEYWYWVLFQTLLLVVLATLDAAFFSGRGVLTGFALVGFVLPGVAVTVRRLHDADYSAWVLLFMLVPAIGIFVLLILTCHASTAEPNRFDLAEA